MKLFRQGILLLAFALFFIPAWAAAPKEKASETYAPLEFSVPSHQLDNFSVRDEGFRDEVNSAQVHGELCKAAIVVSVLALALILFIVTGLNDLRYESRNHRS